ncbi:MAG TPA: FtsX-like permease family protein, partial [Tepidisphaeraceae bacterium]|nr:FtsX-like permease family protein [Tepidisphaeraceae bacterium]
TPQIFEVIRLRLARGTTFSDVQYDRGEAVCVLGAKAAEQMFPFQDPLGAQIMIGTPSMGTTLLTVIGVLEPTGLRADASNADIIQRDIDMDVYLPLTLAWQVFGDSNVRRQAGTFERKRIEITEVWLKANSVDEVESLSKVAENILGLPARLDVQVKAPIEILRAAEQQERTFNFVMGGIAGVSLLVGGIGIMNIMLATVTERTKEIGIRRALGAKQRHIILQFLIETTVIALAGGMIGIGLGVVVATYLDTLVTFVSWILKNAGFSPIVGAPPAVVAMWSVMASCIVSVGIGIGFGIYPAIKAARMDPIEALRHE